MTLLPTPLEEAAKAYRDVTFNALTLDECRDAATAAITAYLAQAEKEGWVMVPVEPTEAMLNAGESIVGSYATLKRAWPAMLAERG